ncbi:MAG: hypothetical protein AAB617_03260 [Patescibacteria group bacterium]
MNALLAIFQKVPMIVLMLIGVLFVALGDFLGKSWSLQQKHLFYFLAILSYGAGNIFYLPTLLREGLVVTTIIWSILVILVSIFIGMVMFGETLSPLRSVGVIFGVVSLVILQMAK